MKLKVEILESSKEISVMIANALKKQVDQFMAQALTKIKSELPALLSRAIEDSPEYTSLLSGELKYEFGIPDSSSKLKGLLDIWTNDVLVNHSPSVISNNGSLKTSISISMVKSDFSNVLGSSYAFVYDNKRGYTLPWLKWLLLDGTMSIVPGYEVVIGPNKRSRTGMAVMANKEGKSWNVPSYYSGSINDNWITRAILSSGKNIDSLIKKAIEK